MRFATQGVIALLLLPALATTAMAKEHPMGPAQEVEGMEFASVYLQPITMDKPMGLPASSSDAHVELDIHATKDNKNALAEGWWVPYLHVSYEIEKIDNRNKKVLAYQSGDLMPMLASDGPHYGANVKLMGPGLYRIKYHITPPNDNPDVEFARHIDEETAGPEWFKPIDLQWQFPWAGTGEKGSY